MKINYFIIPLVVFLVSFLGSQLTSGGMDWYKNIKIPSWTPEGWVIGLVWTLIFILCAISLILIWNYLPRPQNFNLILGVFVINALLNIFWSYLFFYKHLLGYAIFDAAFLALSVLVLIFMILPFNRPASYLLLPYAGWVCFATYLNYNIWLLNK